MAQEELEIITEILRQFYKEYFIEGLGIKNRILPSEIDLNTCLEDDFDFDFEEVDIFTCFLYEKKKIDISKFYQNTHIQGMSYELFRLPTKLLLPLIGLKRWMVFKRESRVPLKIKNLIYALKQKSLKSSDVFESIDRNNEQEQLLKYFLT